jgi:hypothetical protein
MGLPVLKGHGNLAGFVDGVNLKTTGIGRQGVQNLYGLAPQIVAADAAEDGGVVAQAARHDSKVGRRAA